MIGCKLGLARAANNQIVSGNQLVFFMIVERCFDRRQFETGIEASHPVCTPAPGRSLSPFIINSYIFSIDI